MSERLTLYTAPPLKREYLYQKPPYRQIVGVEYSGQRLVAPEHAARHSKSKPEVHMLQRPFARGIMACYRRYYAERKRGEVRNCHLGAATIAGLPHIDGTVDASQAAIKLMRTGNAGHQRLQPGQRGVIGYFEEEEGVKYPFDFHSITGLDRLQALQIDERDFDGLGGQMSIAPYEATLKYYRQTHHSKSVLYA